MNWLDKFYSDDTIEVVAVDNSLYYIERKNSEKKKWEDLFKLSPPKFNGWYCPNCMQDVIVDECPTCNNTKTCKSSQKFK